MNQTQRVGIILILNFAGSDLLVEVRVKRTNLNYIFNENSIRRFSSRGFQKYFPASLL
jgi:hypothetical protein